MSQLSNLKGTIDGIAKGTKQTSSSLSQFKRTFGQHVNSVQSAIGGSSQRKDQEIISVLQDAQSKVDAAAQALERAANTASSYGQSL